MLFRVKSHANKAFHDLMVSSNGDGQHQSRKSYSTGLNLLNVDFKVFNVHSFRRGLNDMYRVDWKHEKTSISALSI